MSAIGHGALDPAELPPDVRLMNAAASVMMIVGALAVIAIALLWLVRQPVFAIRAIQIEGDVTRNSVATIRANAAPRLAGNFLTLDLASARAAFETVPWVRQAVVRRIWPNRLGVELQEHRPAALWGEGATERLVNSHGEVFEANLGDVEEDDLPNLHGPDGTAAGVLAMWRRLGPVFAGLDARVQTLRLSARGSWRAVLDSGARVELGRGSDLEVVTRTRTFVTTLPQVTGRFQRPLAHADLRHNQGYAVRLQGVTTTETPPADKPRRR